MRLWSLHPKYLDSRGLVAAWREALLARAVLEGKTRGYRNHPQLIRFRAASDPVAAINAYLGALFVEAESRGFRFDRGKIGKPSFREKLAVTDGQIEFEWKHLLCKLRRRDQAAWRKGKGERRLKAHPLFRITPGSKAEWERGV